MAGNTIYVLGYDIYSTGEMSFVAKSTNMGQKWEMLPLNLVKDTDKLTAVSFVSENIGWVAGSEGSIYKTTDGGKSWTSQRDTLLHNGQLSDIFFLNADTGFVCGSYSVTSNMLKTTNGGKTWNTVSTGTTNSLEKMYWESKSRGIAVGSSKKIYLTTDGGTTWTNQTYSTVPGSSVTFYDIARLNDSTYFTCGKGCILKSTDHGATFTLLSTPNIDATLTLYSIKFFDDSHGCVVGTNGVVFLTSDKGTTWSVRNSFTSEVLRTQIRLDNKTMLLGGYRSNMFITSDYGTNWKSLANTNRDFYSIYAEDSLNIVIAGGSASTYRGEINLTTDGGKTWDKSPLVIGSLLHDAVKFGNRIYTCGRDGAYYVSTDNGQNWLNYSLPATTAKNYKLFFLDKENGYMVTSEGKILRTGNHGQSWYLVQQIPATLYDIKMTSAVRGFTVGSADRLYETYDSNNWVHGVLSSPSGQITSIYMLNESLGFIAGERGAVYKTDDGFRSVTLLTDTSSLNGSVMRSVFAFNDSTVWAVGTGGVILRSSGPNKMVKVDSANFGEDLSAIARLNDSTIVISGYSGSVYKIWEKKPAKTTLQNDRLTSPEKFALEQNYPNPFNPSTNISYSIAKSGMVTLKIYNILGREVTTLVNSFQNAGSYSVKFDASALSSGIYLYELSGSGNKISRKMVILK
ncbi:MAG: YCF48-related protein [Bacillota bacterium]